MDSLGDRMKTYEQAFRYYLPIHSYVIVRVDGKAFHTFTEHCLRPFDYPLMAAMDKTARELCAEIQGAKFGFVQSDEISILLYDFCKINTSAWFDNNYTKIVSVSASLATSSFIRHYSFGKEIPCGFGFDSRAYILPTKDEVANYFVWRQQDAVRNSIQMAARAEFSHRECMYRNNEELQEMLFKRGINWNDYTVRCKRGGFVSYQRAHEQDAHSSWIFIEPPTFTKDREFLLSRIPDPLQDEP